MSNMQRIGFGFCAFLSTAVVLIVVVVVVGQGSGPDENKSKPSSQIEHGKYLVRHVAQCVQCHTPRDRHGALDEARLLTGAPIPVVGPASSPPWAAEAVSLAGLGNYDVPFIRHLLTRGARPDGTHPKNPMPAFGLNAEDADAVIAYLKSLK